MEQVNELLKNELLNELNRLSKEELISQLMLYRLFEIRHFNKTKQHLKKYDLYNIK